MRSQKRRELILAREAGMLEMAGHLKLTTGSLRFELYVHWPQRHLSCVGFWWPNYQTDCYWEVPVEFYEGPVITLLGAGRLVSPDAELQEEILECYYQYEEKYEEYDEKYGTNWFMTCYDRVSLNGTKFSTFSTDRKRIRKRSTILSRWMDEDKNFLWCYTEDYGLRSIL